MTVRAITVRAQPRTDDRICLSEVPSVDEAAVLLRRPRNRPGCTCLHCKPHQEDVQVLYAVLCFVEGPCAYCPPQPEEQAQQETHRMLGRKLILECLCDA
jgi:hypothetical protein